MSQVRPGMLLVATAELVDPNFADSVVLILDVNGDGALGVVINRPSTVPIDDVLDTWTSFASEPKVLFVGGPVGTDGALAVASSSVEPLPLGFRAVADDLGMVDLDAPSAVVGPALTQLRIFAGYAGWGAGQLEAEIAEGSWYVVPAELADPFRHDAEQLRRDVLRRQPGELAWHVNRPFDPGLN